MIGRSDGKFPGLSGFRALPLQVRGEGDRAHIRRTPPFRLASGSPAFGFFLVSKMDLKKEWEN